MMELWGGIECTRNRVGDGYVDQLDQSGHATRDDDLDRMASLGIRTWRYPVLWERVAPDGPAKADWSWPDRRLIRMRELGLDPIVGLVHHGSGPPSTSLLDPAFPDLLAEYAGAVAERYPWVKRWTPVNEPLSTARFSALDGHWYPHTHTHHAFAKAIVHQCLGVVRAMAAIRRHVPDAELVLTEDLCRHLSTPRLADEAAFRNERRWLAMDLVCGRVTPEHPLHGWLVEHGVDPAFLAELEPTPPAVLGLNYYVTSDRFLDELPERQPPWRRFMGPSGLYGETEAVRCTSAGIVGHHALLLEVWERYRLPVAVTEVHLGCTREEQVRWLLEAWDAGLRAREEGVDVRAITAWGAFGLFGWDKLVVRTGGTYEPGLFDVRGVTPRPTALARVAADLAAGRPVQAPYGGPGWWRRPDRLLGHDPIEAPVRGPLRPLPDPRDLRPVLVTGSGALARRIAEVAAARHLPVVMPGRALDPADPDAVADVMAEVRPWAVFHAAGVRAPGEAERCPEIAERLHARAPGVLASSCDDHRARLVVLSSSRVFSGPGPHDEHAPIAPRGVLGQTQVEGERAVDGLGLVLRCGHIVGLERADDPLVEGLRSLSAGHRWIVPVGEPVIVGRALVELALDLLIDGEIGIWHAAHRADLAGAARIAARLAGFDPERVQLAPAGDAARLRSVRGRLLAPVGAALRGLRLGFLDSEVVSCAS